MAARQTLRTLHDIIGAPEPGLSVVDALRRSGLRTCVVEVLQYQTEQQSRIGDASAQKLTLDEQLAIFVLEDEDVELQPLRANLQQMMWGAHESPTLAPILYSISSAMSKLAISEGQISRRVMWRVVSHLDAYLFESLNTAKVGDTVEIRFANLATREPFAHFESGMNSMEGDILLEIVGRPPDVSGFHSCPDYSMVSRFPSEASHIIPPLTAAVVIGIWPGFKLDSSHPAKDMKKVIVDITFTPQLTPDMLSPPPDVWDAIKDGGTDALARWLERIPLPNLESPHPTFGCTMLYSAARCGNESAVKMLVKRGAQIDSQLSSKRSTALHASSYFGHPGIVKFLLDHCPNYTLVNDYCRTAIKDAEKQPPCKAVFQQHPWSQLAAAGIQTPVDASKFSAPTLKYGDRVSFLHGLDYYIGQRPDDLLAALQAEFARNITWTDIHANWVPDAYNAQHEWSEALNVIDGLMSKLEATMIGGHVKDERIARAAVLGLRLYTTPAYKPLNDFLRKVCDDSIDARERAVLLAPDRSWSAFAHAVFVGFNALAACNMLSTEQDVFRGIGMALPATFFIPDERGMVAAVETAFGSSTTDADVVANFKDAGKASVQMNIKMCPRDANGYHSGVSLEWVSLYPEEEEVLFPPMTIFQVKKVVRKGLSTVLTVCPTWCE